MRGLGREGEVRGESIKVDREREGDCERGGEGDMRGRGEGKEI